MLINMIRRLFVVIAYVVILPFALVAGAMAGMMDAAKALTASLVKGW